MKIKQIYLVVLAALGMALTTHAQLKLGSNPTTILGNTNFEVEATDGKRVKVNKPDGKFYIETKPTAAKTDSVMMRFTDGEVRQMSINRLLGQLDLDGDGIVDAEDPDIDGDGILNAADNCPRQYCQTAPGCPASCAAAPAPSVVADCNTAGFNVGTYISGTALSGRTYTVMITNNSFSTATIAFASSDIVLSGVTGLAVGTPTGSPALSSGSATLAAGGSVTVTYPITGTPASCGTLTGVWTKLSLNCTKTVNVNPNVSCATATWTTAVSPTINTGLINGTAYTGTYSIPYTGGGCTLPTDNITVSGLTLSYAGGTIGTTGNLVYTLSGTYTGTSGGSVTFTTSSGCNVLLAGNCISPAMNMGGGTTKQFLCHNLGADFNLDPHTPVVGLQGAYVQWGRRGPNTTGNSSIDWQTAANTTNFAAAPTSGNANAGSISGWSTTPASDFSWRTSGGAKTADDPCPNGFRVPTISEWTSLFANNTISRTGSWGNGSTSYGSAIHLGPNSTTKNLTLPASGIREVTVTGTLALRGQNGFYWSSTESGTANSSWRYQFDKSSNVTFNDNNRTNASSIRCILE